MVTIATHNGSRYSRDHNRRLDSYVRGQAHIDPNGIHETWHDESIRHAYDRIFGQALADYNAKQTREDRKIGSYLAKIHNDAQKHVAYELIVGIYGRDEMTGLPICDAETGKQIMRGFVDTWQERNPNLQLIGAYYHADEQGEPHVHIDYIPVAYECKRGLETQNALVRALGQQGFTIRGRETAQIQWERRENQTLEQLCSEHGLIVEHPTRETREHLDTETYKAYQERDHAIDQVQELEAIRNRELQRISRLADKAQWALESARFKPSSRDDSGRRYISEAEHDHMWQSINALQSIKKDVRTVRTSEDIQTALNFADEQARQAEADRQRATLELQAAHEEAERIKADAARIRDEANELKESQERSIFLQAYDMVHDIVRERLQALCTPARQLTRFAEYVTTKFYLGIDSKQLQADFEKYELQQERDLERKTTLELHSREKQHRDQCQDRGLSR